jgi:poly(hydroxyalkanoate) depolymerase family esterase
MPEQAVSNNCARCFQWLQPTETMREHGEAGSIAAMTQTALERFEADPARVFIVGLSAGGATAAAMLAAYPDLFCCGCRVAGLPMSSASPTIQGLLRMANPWPEQRPSAWAERVWEAGPRDYWGGGRACRSGTETRTKP